MTEDLLAEGASPQLGMNQTQFAQLITTVAAALRQPTTPLDPSQQSVALRFRLLRNGLGRFHSASEAFDQALIRIDQIQHQGWIQLVIHDPIPDAARTMVLIVGSQRIPQDLPVFLDDGRLGHRITGYSVTQLIELVEFLDQFEVPIAAGVPVQLQAPVEEERPTPDIAEGDSDFITPTSRDVSAVSRTKPKLGR